MIYSMTGYGKGEAFERGHRITAEIRSVNNRYLDLNLRMPRAFNAFDNTLRTLVKRALVRGKVDVFIGYETEGDAVAKVTYNEQIAAQYVNAMRGMAQALALSDDITVTTIARLPEVFQIDDSGADEELLKNLLTQAMCAAIDRLQEAKAKEGAYLTKDIRVKLDLIREHVAFIRDQSPKITKAYEQKMKDRIRELLEEKNVDEARLLTEVAIFADKTSVDEELVRLSGHIDAFTDLLDDEKAAKEGVGRKLDFIVQEMNREANTTLSKSPDMEISAHAVEITTEIEKIREQIQNLE